MKVKVTCDESKAYLMVTQGLLPSETKAVSHGIVTQKSRNTQKYYQPVRLFFNRPAEIAEKAEIFSLYGCIRVIREIRVPLHHSLYGCFLKVPQAPIFNSAISVGL